MRKEVLHHINVPKKILTHVLGKDHPTWSRLLLGGIIMALGSLIREDIFILKSLAGLIHATGAVPWLESMIAMSEPIKDHSPCENCSA